MATFHSDEGMLDIQLYNVWRHDKEMIKEKPRWKILIIKTRQSGWKIQVWKTMIWLGFCTELITVALHYYILCPPKVFLGSTTFFYINGPQLLFQWDFTSTVMQFWNMALPYQPQIIWFLPVIAIGLHRKRNNSKVFLFSFLLVKNSVSTTFKRDWYI